MNGLESMLHWRKSIKNSFHQGGILRNNTKRHPPLMNRKCERIYASEKRGGDKFRGMKSKARWGRLTRLQEGCRPPMEGRFFLCISSLKLRNQYLQGLPPQTPCSPPVSAAHASYDGHGNLPHRGRRQGVWSIQHPLWSKWGAYSNTPFVRLRCWTQETN